MPPLETMDRTVHAVLWVKTGDDGAGDPVLADPVEIRVRWVDRRTEAADQEGDTFGYDVAVVVAQAVVDGSILWRGRLADWSIAAANRPELMQVVGVTIADDLKGRHTRRELRCMRYHGTLPAYD